MKDQTVVNKLKMENPIDEYILVEKLESVTKILDNEKKENEDCNNDSKIINEDLENKHYQNARDYWANISPTVDGMLGGFGSISFSDIRASTNFLNQIFKLKPSPGKKYALDCGAGIGRVSKNLLIPIFEKVDLVEQDKHFCDLAKESIGKLESVGTIFNVGLQDFSPPDDRKYDVIWSQWVLGHLTDIHLIQFFNKCASALNKGGVIIVKENVTSDGEREVDTEDSSVTRPLKDLKFLLSKSNLRIIKEVRQSDFPKGLFPVYTLALRPVKKNV